MLFLSSYIPLYILLIGKDLIRRFTYEDKFLIPEKINLFNGTSDYINILLLILSVFSIIQLKRAIKNSGEGTHSLVMEVENKTASHFLNYISIYLISCVGLSINKPEDVFVFIFLMFLIGYIYISNNMFYINPTLNLMGYKVFDVKLEFFVSQGIESTILVANQKKDIKIGTIIETSMNNSGFVFLK